MNKNNSDRPAPRNISYDMNKARNRVQSPLQKRKANKLSKLKFFSIRSGLDMPFFSLIMIILIIGLIMLYSASYPFASHNHNGDSSFFIRSQLLWALFGVVSMMFISYFDYHHLHKIAIPALMLSFILLVAVLFAPTVNGVHRWIFGFQPSEITKFAIVLCFAHFISIYFKKMGTFTYGILPYSIIIGLTAFLLYLEPHMSCLIIVVLLAAGMMYIGGVQLRWFGFVLIAALAGVAFLVLSNKLSYANDRVISWLDPFAGDPELTWQTRQGLLAIGSGGIWGLGLGQSRQKYLYVPEPQNDFIFSVVCEELGFIGALIILVLFAMLIWRGIIISMRAKDKFGVLLGVGLTAQVGLQVILNIFVVTNTIPNTGISLTFFSYGGTSLVMLLAQMGIILSISRTANLEKN